MDLRRAERGIWESLEEGKERETCCNYILLSKIKINNEKTGLDCYPHSGE